MNQKYNWNSILTFLFAMIGATIGIGNIWRFSYVLYTNGGGSFFIPYFIAIIVMGIPFLILEYGLGFSSKKSFSKILHDINPKFEVIAWLLVLFVFIVAIYYMVIISWDLVYLFNSFTFSWQNNVNTFFAANVGGSSNLGGVTSIIIPTFIGILILWALLWFVSNKDVDVGIGSISKILIPLLFIIMAFIFIYAFTLPGFYLGISTLLTPNWAMLLDGRIWISAFAQIIFSLSIGQAMIVTYASYLSEESNLIDNVLMVVIANSIYEIFIAFGIFSILGYMSVTHSIPINQLISEGTSLIFIVLPEIFSSMGLMGRILAPLLFLAIFFAGFTSALALVEPLLYSLCDKFNWSRRKGVSILVVVGCSGSLLFSTGIGSYLLQIVDSFVNEFAILILIAIQSIIFTRFYDIDGLIPILNNKSMFNVGKKWKFILKYVLPIMLIIIWLMGIIQLAFELDVFKVMIYLIITLVVSVLTICLVKVNPKNNKA